MRLSTSLLITFLITIVFYVQATAQNRGILNKPAPEWNLDQWFNLPEDKESLTLKELRGKVVYLYCFQSWCPGCMKYGFPTLQKVYEHYKDNKNVAFIAAHTVFEGFDTNTLASAKETIKRFGLTIPMAHDPGFKNSGSFILKNYRTGGTPWTIIIDPKGIVRFNDFHIEPEKAIQTVNSLLDDAGLISNRIGERFENLPSLNWIAPNDKHFTFKDSKLTLMRWFTDGCPHCIPSVPALQALADQYDDNELRFVAVYHPKPVSRHLPPSQIQMIGKQIGATNSIAVDHTWNVLKKEWLDTGSRGATSVTFLIDNKGVIRYIHPGPRIFRSINPANRQANQDMIELESTIASILKTVQ